MKYKEYLLSDENELSYEDYLEREKLVKEFSGMPVEFFQN